MKFISAELIILLLMDFVFVLFSILIIHFSLIMVRNFDFGSSENLQYNLEKKGVLISSIVSFLFFTKISFFFYFLYFLDQLAPSIRGAMCAAGVLNLTPYGNYLILLKLLVIFMLFCWYYINVEDERRYGYIFSKLKYKLLLFICAGLFLEIFLELNLFYNINPEKIVICCSSIFIGEPKNFSTFMLDIENSLSATMYILSFVLLGIFYFLGRYTIYGLLTLFFGVVSVYSFIDFFSTYIYELPTHRCPFCILQKDYYYIGYLIYFLVFVGIFYGTGLFFLRNIVQENTKKVWIKISLLTFTLYTMVIFYYVISYFIKSGTWL